MIKARFAPHCFGRARFRLSHSFAGLVPHNARCECKQRVAARVVELSVRTPRLLNYSLHLKVKWQSICRSGKRLSNAHQSRADSSRVCGREKSATQKGSEVSRLFVFCGRNSPADLPVRFLRTFAAESFVFRRETKKIGSTREEKVSQELVGQVKLHRASTGTWQCSSRRFCWELARFRTSSDKCDRCEQNKQAVECEHR